jgi:hypothetical protein
VNAATRGAIASWYARHRARIDEQSVADVGSYCVNGGVRDMLPHVTGFDLEPGPGVDVVLAAGEVPPPYRGAFAFATCVGCLSLARSGLSVVRELALLLAPGGELLVVTCSAGCRVAHSSSPGHPDARQRPTAREIGRWLEAFFSEVTSAEVPADDLLVVQAQRNALLLR